MACRAVRAFRIHSIFLRLSTPINAGQLFQMMFGLHVAVYENKRLLFRQCSSPLTMSQMSKRLNDEVRRVHRHS